MRTGVDRCAGDGAYTVEGKMQEARCKGIHHLEVRDPKGRVREAALEVRYRRLRILPSRSKQRRYAPLEFTVLRARERRAPKGGEAIHWKLLTDLPVRSRAEAIETLSWYAMRWKVETFHKILKSGCKAEQAKLRTAERLVNLAAILCILAWRVFWMTMLNRSAVYASPKLALTVLEIERLDQLVRDKGTSRKRLSGYLTKLAQLGGYLARAHDPPPGCQVIWRGLARLTDIELGYIMGAKSYG